MSKWILSWRQEREVFKLIADPITNYFMEQGINKLEAGVLATTMSGRILDNLSHHIVIAGIDLTDKDPGAKIEGTPSRPNQPRKEE